MKEEIIKKIKEAGVVGAGGAGFPTHVKLSFPAKTVIVNGAECEPLLRVDRQLLEKNTGKIVQGLNIAAEATGASELIIALKAKYKGAVEALRREIKDSRIRLHILDDFYPAGDEQVLVAEVTGRIVPQGGIPLQVECVVINVETLLNVVDAQQGKAVTHTYLTVTGAVGRPVTLKVPIGTAVADVLAAAGQVDLTSVKVIEGGPMMGSVIADLGQPVTKTTKGLIVLPADHALVNKKNKPVEQIIRQARTACIGCRICTDMCPRFLLGHNIKPHKIMRSLKYIEDNEQTVKMALLCSECGVCEQYACVMGLSPKAINNMLKNKLREHGVKITGLPAGRQQVADIRGYRKIPSKRLVARLNLEQYDQDAPLTETNFEVRQVNIKLKQHTGSAARPIVVKGQTVSRGELVAEIPGNSLGANVHASIDGIVTGVGDSILITAVKEGGK